MPVAQGRRRHHGDQLGHLLPRARGGAGGLARALRDRLGARARRRVRRGRGVPPRHPARPRADGTQRPAGDGGRGGARRQRRRRSPATPAAACSAAPAPSAARSTPSAGCTSATCRARSRPERGSAPGSRRAGSSSRTAARSASSAGRRPATAAGRAYEVRARRAVIVAGGALGTPELLQRSGLGGGQVGRNLHIHPACWVGARYEEEVRGWDGVMQSFYVDEWERERVLLEATFTPLAFGGAWLLGAGPQPPGGDARLRPRRLDRRPPLRPLRAAGSGSAREGSLRASYRLTATTPAGSPSASPAPPRSTSPPAPPRSTRTSPGSGCCARATWPSSRRPRFKPAELRLEAFHPMGTARIAADPREGVCAPDGSVHGAERPLRRRRLALPDLARRQPDDDDHRLRQADLSRRRGGMRASVGLCYALAVRAREDSLRRRRLVATPRGVATAERGAALAHRRGSRRRRRAQAVARPRKAPSSSVAVDGDAAEAAEVRRHEDPEEDQQRREAAEHGDRRAGRDRRLARRSREAQEPRRRR